MSHHAEKPPEATVAAAVGGKTARACDSCLSRRARWYCAADDAFLCQACDSTVHSANRLARRHERLRLKISSFGCGGGLDCFVPAWHHGFKRKARTPRPHHHAKPVVPELETSGEADGEGENVEEEEQLLYRVPTFDPAVTALASLPASRGRDWKSIAAAGGSSGDGKLGLGFMPSEVDMAEFAADMERLLGRGLEGGDSFCMKELGLVDSGEDAVKAGAAGCGAGSGCQLEAVKAETLEDRFDGEVGLSFEMEVDLSRETLELDFHCGSPAAEVPAAAEGDEEEEEKQKGFPRGMALKLDYEAVIAAWSVQGCSPWTSGERPHLGPEECWLQCMQGMWGGGGMAGGGGIQVMDVGREARVTRYREKRRTRLFSKKIRYEVRKLNAEKRPRMKGRFVKRTSFSAAGGSSSIAAAPTGNAGGSACLLSTKLGVKLKS